MAFRNSPTADAETIAPSSLSPPRIDSLPTSSEHKPDHYEASHRRPSPPPIATVDHSPPLSVSSLDRSSVSSPPPHQHSLHTPPIINSHAPYNHTPQMRQSPGTHHGVPAIGRSNGNLAHYHSSFDNRYESNQPSNPSPYNLSDAQFNMQPISHAPPNNRDGYNIPYPHPGQSSHIIYTDDATTKLSERVRRRCFNCCTTDTSTWRRSNLSPGKVLCNKCGLFERTHSRPRPEQFPHKRGPLTAIRPRTPPLPHQLPPISNQNHNHNHNHTQNHNHTHVHTLQPLHYSYPSIAPLSSLPDSRRQYQPNSLPEIQSWLHDSSHPAAASQASAATRDAGMGLHECARVQNAALEPDNSSNARSSLA